MLVRSLIKATGKIRAENLPANEREKEAGKSKGRLVFRTREGERELQQRSKSVQNIQETG